MPVSKLAGKILKLRSEMKQFDKDANAFVEGMQKGHDEFLQSLEVLFPEELQSMVDNIIMPMMVDMPGGTGVNSKPKRVP